MRAPNLRSRRRLGALVAGAFAVTTGTAVAVAQHQRPPVPPDRLPQPASQLRAVAGQVGVLPVQGNVYLLNLGDVNIVAQVGDDGILLVDSGPADWAERVQQTLRDRFGNRPLRVIVNTHVHPENVGGNAALAKALGPAGGGGGGGGAAVRIIAHENTLNRMNGVTDGEKELPLEMLPTSTFFTPKKEIYFNGEPIEILHQPDAHTDGDVMVFFRGSDVIAAGDLFSTASYPIFDDTRGSTMQGYLDALNRMLDITVPRFNQQGGTMVIPSHGRLSNESDVDDYRNWMTIVRDRIQEMSKKGMTLAQVKAARPTLDFDGVFSTPRWTTDQFVEAVYRDLNQAAAPAKKGSE
jgi:glyoxylase-like metal-dependent hydrolase (beta-lactamase superfamily II)